ncbi:MAG: hypothetical protein PHE09_08080 [Oscillospiraceae bacterium]|nr:hypothetical protein [Oscillospiraceae bacterium]
MAEKTYTYDPGKINQNGKDRMRFELGDTMVEGAAETAALTDEEIQAVMELYPKRWKRAKLALVESLCRRFAFEVDTDVGPLSLGLQGRVEAWREMYKELKAEIGNYSVPSANPAAINSAPYFYAGMMDNHGTGHKEGGGNDVP